MHPVTAAQLAQLLSLEESSVYRNLEVREPHELDTIRTEIRDRFGLTVRFAHFPIVGLCAECAATGTTHHHGH